MTEQHPEFAEEQAFIDHAYVCLEESRTDALKMRELTTTGPGGTFQARFERNAEIGRASCRERVYGLV